MDKYLPYTGLNGVENFMKGRCSWILFHKDLISFCLYSSERLMASPLFRIDDSELAVWKTGSNEIVGSKMAV
jgi:hypothetical protein